jgi:hypothetical protein
MDMREKDSFSSKRWNPFSFGFYKQVTPKNSFIFMFINTVC